MHLLLFIFLLDHVAMVTASPSCRDTTDTDGRLTKNCTAADLSDVPSGLDPQTKVLLFPDNWFTAVTWSSFQAFPEIYHIDLTGNKIPEVTPSSPPLLPTLKILRLSSNRLTSLPDHAFSACPALNEVHLDNNNINSLSDQTFSGLSQLEILDLSSNKITVLPKLMLHPLRRIETLIIEKNEIKLMPHDWFVSRLEVPYLFLSANPWDCTCSNLYLQEYMAEYDVNFYIRVGPTLKVAPEKVVCASPPWHKSKPVVNLEEYDLCSREVPSRGDFLIPEDPTTTIPPLPPTIYPTTSVTTSPPPTTAPTLPDVVTESVTSFTEWVSYTELGAVMTEDYWEIVTDTSFVEVNHVTEETAHQTTTTQTTPAGTTTSLPPTMIPVTSRVQEATQSTTPEVTTLTAATTPATTTPLTTTPLTTAPLTTTPLITTPLTTTPLTTTPSLTTPVLSRTPTRLKAATVGEAGVFCFWLFVGLLLLCVASAACMLLTLWRLLVWYVRVYKPLREAVGRKGGSEGLRLLTCDTTREETPGGGGVMALYRSILYIHREEGEAEETAQEGAEGGTDQLSVIPRPTEEGGAGGGGGVYRKTLYRLISKEDTIEGWRDVVEECRVSTEEGGKRGGASRERSGGASRKRYSVILREEREEAGLEREEVDWVVGGWEVKRGEDAGAEPRSSWGEWLEHYLPRMPWAVTTPTEGEVPQ